MPGNKTGPGGCCGLVVGELTHPRQLNKHSRRNSNNFAVLTLIYCQINWP